jgi:hypothetical protein
MAGTYTPLSTAVLPGAAGYANAVNVTLSAMSQSTAFASQNAKQTQSGMQQINTVTTATMVSQIMQA